MLHAPAPPAVFILEKYGMAVGGKRVWMMAHDPPSQLLNSRPPLPCGASSGCRKPQNAGAIVFCGAGGGYCMERRQRRRGSGADYVKIPVMQWHAKKRKL